MDVTSSSQPNPMTEQHILFDDVRNFLSAVDGAYVKYSFQIDRPEIEESQIKLRYHPLTKNGSRNAVVDGWLQIYLRALGYKGGENLVEKDRKTPFENGIHYRLVTVNNTGKKQNSLNLQLSVANGKNLQLQKQNIRLQEQKKALQRTKTDLENVLAKETIANSDLGTLFNQKERQNENLKSLNTENSKRIEEIQGKVNEVLQKLQQELREKCPDNFQSSSAPQH